MAGGEIRVAGVLSAVWNLPAGLERYRTLAVRTPRVARSLEKQSGSVATQNVRGTAACPGSDRMAAGAWRLESRVERMGISSGGNWRLGAVVVSPARSRDARGTPHRVDGANPIRASEIFTCWNRCRADERAIRSGDILAGNLSESVALIDAAAGNSLDVLSRVDGWAHVLTTTPIVDKQA